MQTRATQLIAWTGCDAALWEPAVAYLKIRAIAAPFVLVTMCAQAGLLAQQDAVTPLLVSCILKDSVLNASMKCMQPSDALCCPWQKCTIG